MDSSGFSIEKLCTKYFINEPLRLVEELQSTDFYLIEKEIQISEINTKETNADQKIGTKSNDDSLKREIENKFLMSKTKFITICFYNKVNLTICFEKSCFVFKGISNSVGKSENSKDTLDIGMNLFILSILKKMQNKITLLFTSPKEDVVFQRTFGELGDGFIIPDKYFIANIETEVNNFSTALNKRCTQKNNAISDIGHIAYRAILAYIIRRNFYESSSFYDPSFFDTEIDDEIKEIKNHWENILNKFNQDCHEFSLFHEITNARKNLIKELPKADFISLRNLGGTFASVYLKIHYGTMKLLVQKKYLENFENYESEKNNYLKLDIQHPNIVRCFGYYEKEKAKSLFLEFMSNDSLHTLLGCQEITESMKYKYFFSVIFALENLYYCNLIHRDLKLDNVFVDHDFNAKVGDFNTSKLFPQNSVSNSFGSEKYSCPEIQSRGKYSYSSDVYSFGIILYELFLGKILPPSFRPSNNTGPPIEYGFICRVYEECVKKERIDILGLINMFKNDLFSNDIIEKVLDLFNINDVVKYCLFFCDKVNLGIVQYNICIAGEYLINKNRSIDMNYDKIIKNLLQIFKELNNEYALYYMGWAYLIGKFEQKDFGSKKSFFNLYDYQFEPPRNLGRVHYQESKNPLHLKRAIKYFELAAKSNNLQAQIELANIYYQGLSDQKDIKKAIGYFEQAGKQNDSQSLNNLGGIYSLGRDIPKDMNKAIFYFNLAAKLNNPKALFNLGKIYLNGEGVVQDVLRAIFYFESSGKLNFADSFAMLGGIYYSGIKVQKDINKAVDYYNSAANLNSIEALNMLGYIFLNGVGVANNSIKAIKYYEQSAEQNNTEAQYNLGCIYMKGIGITTNVKRAIYYFEKAAVQDYAAAQFSLGSIYLNGTEVPKNTMKALHYLELSANNEYHTAQIFPGVYYHLYKNDFKKALPYYKESSNFNILGAKNNIGVMFLQLAENEKNEAASRRCVGNAIEYFREAASSKDTFSIVNLALVHSLKGFNFVDIQRSVDLINTLKLTLNGQEYKTDKTYVFAAINELINVLSSEPNRSTINSKYHVRFLVYNYWKGHNFEAKDYYFDIRNCNSDFYQGLKF